MTLGQKPSSAPSLGHVPRSFELVALPHHGCKSTSSNVHLQPRQSWGIVNDDRSDGNLHGFESDYVASKNDGGVGFEIDVGEIVTSLARID